MTSFLNGQQGSVAEQLVDRLSPYIEWDSERIHNPHRNISVVPGSREWDLLMSLRSRSAAALSEADVEHLASRGWLVPPGEDLSSSYFLRIVSLEVASHCNQKCYFCPVSVEPREDLEMPEELFEAIVGQLVGYRTTLEGVFLQSYNEPTVDRRFVQHCRRLMAADLPVAVLTNGSGLSSKRVDEILEAGKLRYLGVNLSTLDRERYKADRGADHLPVVLRNLDYIAAHPVADEMTIVVLGQEDETHKADVEAIRERFKGTPFKIEGFSIMDRAGYFEFGLAPEPEGKKLVGCDNMGSRPIQHLHITPSGSCVLCCQDYSENYVVGDLNGQSIHEVMSGARLSEMRRWAYGIEEGPEDFICKRCIFARYEEDGRTPGR